MDGTHGEMAQSVILDNTEFCLRCLIDEKWLKDGSIRTSCSGPQIMRIDGVDEIVRTSNLASSMAAHLSMEQLRGSVIGTQGVMNRRLTYTAFPNLELSVSHPQSKCNCHGCMILPPEKIEWLHGSVLDSTLTDALGQISAFLGTTDFEISTHRLNYGRITYSGFVTADVCRSCGKPIRVMRHEGRIFPNDLLCKECLSEGKLAYKVNADAEILYAFTSDCKDAIRNMTLYDLGYPLGAHIEVIKRNDSFDCFDTDKIETTIFAFDEDNSKMHSIHKL